MALYAGCYIIGASSRMLLFDYPLWVSLTVGSLVIVVWWLAWEFWINEKES